MCGIVGYAGNVETVCGKPLEVCLQGLRRLEYRGYDSAGVALTAPGMDHVEVRKKAGRLANLIEDVERKPMPMATVGIGHTRWATTGPGRRRSAAGTRGGRRPRCAAGPPLF